MVPGDMVEVTMAGHGEQRALGQPGQLFAQADQPRAAVDQHIPVTALDMPEVATVKRADIRLVDQAYAIAHSLDFEPLIAADDFHWAP
ncbi:hypothetical protein D3C76_695960 [compost metagenome]